MKIRLLIAALAATGFAWPATPALAGCVIAPDGRSINVVTDNASSDERTCAVSCKVDTKIGMVQVSCGGNTPPFAKAHSLCDYDKPDAYYKKVISSEDSCKTAANAAPAPAAAAPALQPGGFTCRISADGKSAAAVIFNPYKTETSCYIDCKLSTTKAGTTFSLSCGRPAAPDVEAVLCSHSFDGGKIVKMVDGKGSCTDPTPKPSAADKDDEETDPVKLMEKMRKNMPPPARKQESVEDMQKLMNDPDKMDEYIQKQMNPDKP